VRIKVAKLVNNIATPLTTQELVSFQNYALKIKPPGISVIVSSISADKLNVSLNVVYDSLILTSSGTLITDGTEVIKNAVNDYIAAIVYGGKLNKTKLMDAIQAVAGVIDVTIYSLEVQVGTSSAWNAILLQNYEAVSGYFKLNDLTLNMTPNV